MAAADRTKQALAQALKELMQAQPLEKISVGDITAHAQMGRNTFYYHFKDKYDLVNWIFESECGSLMKVPANAQEMEEGVLTLQAYIRENLTFYRNALEYSGQNSLQDYIYEMLESRFAQRIRQEEEARKLGMQEDEVRFAAAFFASALQGLLVRGVRSGRSGDSVRYSECVRRLFKGRMLESYMDTAWQEKPGEK